MHFTTRIIPAMVAMALLQPALAQVQPKTDEEKLSYSFGVQFSRNIMSESMVKEPDAFIQGVTDTFKQGNMKLTDEEMRQILVNYQQQELQKQGQQATDNKAEGERYLASNAGKEGVVQMPSGLQYRIVREGTGRKPGPTDTVEVNYEGTLIDGTVFDSSYQRGESISFQVNGVIQGWQEALQLMSEGSKWQVVIPSQLAYGERAVGNVIGPNSTLVFDIELLSIK